MIMTYTTVSDEHILCCMEWAFGRNDEWPEWMSYPERWNKKHGDLFVLRVDSDLDAVLNRVVDAYIMRGAQNVG